MKNKILFYGILLGVLLSFTGIGCMNIPATIPTTIPIVEGKELVFETIEKGYVSGHNERKNYVITNEYDWLFLWDKVNSTVTPTFVTPTLSQIPQIDFTQNMIIAVFQGTFGSTGYGIEIIKVIETENTLEIFVKETHPGRRCVVGFMVTNPYHIIKVKRTDKEISFNVEKEYRECY